MKTRIFLTTAVVILTVSRLFSQSYLSRHSELSGKSSYGFTDLQMTNPAPHLFAASPRQELSGFDNSISSSYIKTNILNVTPKKKSPWLAAGMSALLPGAGEFYGKSYLKAAIFFGVEVLTWGSFAYFRVKGDNQTDSFEKYANQNWDVRRYARWLLDQNFQESGGINPNEPDLDVLRAQINACESANFSHTLPEYYSQQYYEVIGKYQNFQGGWSDAENSSGWILTKQNFATYHTNMFDFYAGERQKANDFYNYATAGAIVVIVNHILSAADAAWTISLYNKKIKMETGFNIKRYESPFTGQVGNLPSFNLKVIF